MEFRQLECFLAVCDTLHFTRAAERLGTSQPTLSYQIKLLEQELGMPLFDRIGKKVVLTEAGRLLRRHGIEMFGALHGARNAIRDLGDVRGGSLAVGTLVGELNEWVSGLLIPFCREHPAIDVRLQALEDVAEPLLSLELDLAVTILPAEDERFESIPLYAEDYCAVSRRGGPLEGGTPVTFGELMKQPLVLFPPTHRCRQLIDKTGGELGIKVRPRVETSAIESVLQLVEAGVGVSILSKTLLELHPRESIVAVPIAEPSMKREIGLVYVKDRYRGKIVERFIDLLIRDARGKPA